MGHSHDILCCFRPTFFLENRARFSLQSPAPCCGGWASCSFLLVVCAWLALPLLCDFVLRQNRWLAYHDVDTLLQAVQSSVSHIDVHVVDGRATWSSGDQQDCGTQDVADSHFMPRVEFPRSFYQLFEDSAGTSDPVSSYAFDTAMATTLRWLDPSWGEDAYNFQVATPVEFIEAETVEARPPGSITWNRATIASVEPSTKLNKFNYTLKWLNNGGSDALEKQHEAADTKNSAPDTESAASGPSDQVIALTTPGTVFTGMYDCSNGKPSPFKVKFQDHSSRSVYAEFSFHHDAGNSKVCNGSFDMVGKLSGTSRLELQPVGEFGSQTDGWNSNLCNYSSVALVGELDTGEESVPAFRGHVLDAFNVCSRFAGFVQPASESFSARVSGRWWGNSNTDRTVRLEISTHGARMELMDIGTLMDNSSSNSSSAGTKDSLLRRISAAVDSVHRGSSSPTHTTHEEYQENHVSSDKLGGRHGEPERVGEAWLALATAVSDLLEGDGPDAIMDDDDVLRLLIMLALAEHSVLEFGLTEIESWEVRGESMIALKLKFDIGETYAVTQPLAFEVSDPSVVASALRRQVVYALNVQGKDQLARNLLEIARPDPVCPSNVCDIRLKSSRIRRVPALVFGSDREMADETFWPQQRAVVVITETSMYLFEGYSHHFGAYWRLESDEDGSGGPRLPLTEHSLRQHTPLWLYVTLLCDKDHKSLNRVKGSPTLNLDCTAEVADEKLRAMADMAVSYGIAFAMKFRVHVFLINLGVWMAYTLHVFTYHALSWILIYVPSAYVVVNLLRHVDTATASVNQVAAISVYTYTPLLVFTDVIAATLQIDRRSNDFVDGFSIPPEIRSLLDEVLRAFWTQLVIYVLWTAYVLHLLRAKEDEAKCAAATVARGRRMEQASKYEDSFYGEPMCRICLGDEDDGHLISPCLCKGTMRFVHVDCLTQWRTTSQNKDSFFACDSCQYQYSFRRPAWASLLRSALVVHLVAVVLFVFLIALCGHCAAVADRLLLDDALSNAFAIDDVQMAEVHQLSMELYGEVYGGLFKSNDLSILGLSTVQLMTGAAVVGLGGFMSSGFITALIWGRRDNGIFFFAIIYGLIVSFVRVYHAVKDISSAWLKLAESTVLDVGDGVGTHGYLTTHSMALFYRVEPAGGHEPRLFDWYNNPV